MSCILSPLVTVMGYSAPPFTVPSLALIRQSMPCTLPTPATVPAVGTSPYSSPRPAVIPSSQSSVPGSRIPLIRSLASIFLFFTTCLSIP